MTEKCSLAKLLGKALFYSSLQSSFGSVEMSSKFSVVNFAKDQETLQSAADALCGYIIIASIWTVATMLVLYGSYQWKGAIAGLVSNLIMMAWIVGSYIYAFKKASNKYNLKMPKLFC